MSPVIGRSNGQPILASVAMQVTPALPLEVAVRDANKGSIDWHPIVLWIALGMREQGVALQAFALGPDGSLHAVTPERARFRIMPEPEGFGTAPTQAPPPEPTVPDLDGTPITATEPL